MKELNYQMTLRGETKTAAELNDSLITSIDNVFDDVINGDGTINSSLHPEEHYIFDNKFKVIDGPW